MKTVDRKNRWCSGMELLNVLLPPSVTHKKMVQISWQLGMMSYRFQPWDGENDAEHRTVADIVEFLDSRVRFIVFENERGDRDLMLIEYIGEDRRPTDHPGHRFTMELLR